MIALKLLFLVVLLAGTSSAFAVNQPGSYVAKAKKTSTILKLSGGADTPPELKVCFQSIFFGLETIHYRWHCVHAVNAHDGNR